MPLKFLSHLAKSAALLMALSIFFLWGGNVMAQETPQLMDIPIQPCNKNSPNFSCPNELFATYDELGEACAQDIEEFKTNPTRFHYWIEDPDITEQGKANERARQFIYWTLNTQAIDSAAVLREIWQVTSTIALFGIILIAAIFGIGYIVSRRTDFDFRIKIWPTLRKLGIMLLYVALSAGIVFILISLSEVLMKFFIENLGGRDLFNIYFAQPGDAALLGRTETNYTNFVGCRDLNIRVQEGINTELFMLKLTNVTYYVMGVMLILRKILLWFLLFVAPFLALLMPFILIRNIGWIWIGVFFQWLFYGPLLALFLGALSKIWKAGIPFNFDFSRVQQLGGYIYPTGINILYGGPAQIGNRSLHAMNNGNYIDTFAEYVITLIMLWAVTFFPWWLLRIFRDTCCDGIYAMRNILLAMYDQMRGGPSDGPSPSVPPTLPSLKIDTDEPVQQNIRVNIGNLDQIRKTITQDLAKNLQFNAKNIQQIARLETNKQSQTVVNRNIAYLANPVKAQIPAERQQYMNLRSELFNRAIKNDTVARTILASTSTSEVEKTRIREQILRSLPKTESIQQIIFNETRVSKENIQRITNSYTKSIVNNNQVVNQIAKTTNTSQQQVKSILQSYSNTTSQPLNKVIETIARENNTTTQTVKKVLTQSGAIGTQSLLVQATLQQYKLNNQQASKIFGAIKNAVVTDNSLVNQLHTQTSLSQEESQNVVNTYYQTVINDQTIIQNIAEKSQTAASDVKHILNTYVSNLSQPANVAINKTAKETGVSRESVQTIVNHTNDLMRSETIYNQVAEKNHLTKEELKTVVEVVTQPVTLAKEKTLEQRLTTSETAPQITQQHLETFIQNIQNNSQILQTVEQVTNVSQPQIQNVLNSYASHMYESSETLVQNISHETNISKEQVQNIMNSVATTINKSENAANQLAQQTNIQETSVKKITNAISQSVATTTSPASLVQALVSNSNQSEQQVKQVLTEVFHNLTQNQNVMNSVQEQTLLNASQIQQIATQITNNIDLPIEKIKEAVVATTTIPPVKVEAAINVLAETAVDSTIVNQTSQQTNIDESTVQNITNALAQTVSQQAVSTPAQPSALQQVTQSPASITRENVQNIINNVSQNQQIVNNVAAQTQVDQSTTQNILNAFNKHIDQSSSEVITNIANETNTTEENVTKVLQSTSNEIASNASHIQNIAKSTNIEESTVSNVVNSIEEAITTVDAGSSPVTEMVSTTANISADQSRSIVKNVMTAAANNETVISAIQQQTNLQPMQIENVLSTYTQYIDQPTETIINKIHESSGVPKEQVQNILVIAVNTIESSQDLTNQIAEQEGLPQEEVAKVMDSQVQLTTAPEEHIEKAISIPQSISIEDYEEVKEMWINHYEEGEVPVSENIQSREDWVSQEIVYITNTLNKILSPDEKLQQQGLDELGYLLPIFLINNLKGEELVVYLKAKLEAAKLVNKMIEREKRVKDKYEKKDEDEEVLVKLKKKKDDQKYLHMELDEDKEKLGGIEDRVKAAEEKLQQSQNSETPLPPDDSDPLAAIKSRLEEEAEK